MVAAELDPGITVVNQMDIVGMRPWVVPVSTSVRGAPRRVGHGHQGRLGLILGDIVWLVGRIAVFPQLLNEIILIDQQGEAGGLHVC